MDAASRDPKICLISNYTDCGQSYVTINSDLLGKLTNGEAKIEAKNYQLGMTTK